MISRYHFRMKAHLLKRMRNLTFQEHFGRLISSFRTSRIAPMLGLVFVLIVGYTPLQGGMDVDEQLCGNGSAPDYGFSYDLLQPHWTVGWEDNVSQQTVRQVDNIFDRLNEDSIAQPMILILPAEQVGIRTNCAVHFLRYMKLGLPTGPHKDNGFVFLIVTESDSIDVHYAVGLGLPALTAPELTNINRAVEDTYASTHSLDQALLTLAKEFNTVARNNYESETVPLHTSTPSSPVEQPAQPTGQPVGSVFSLAFCGQVCLGALLIWFMIWMFTKFAGGASGFNMPYSGPWDGTRSRGGFRGFPPETSPQVETDVTLVRACEVEAVVVAQDVQTKL